VVDGAEPISSGANGLLLGQLTTTPGMSASEAGSGHGSPSRDQLTAAATAGNARAASKIARRHKRDPAIARGRHSVFLKTAW
jgi:hypothetical protein